MVLQPVVQHGRAVATPEGLAVGNHKRHAEHTLVDRVLYRGCERLLDFRRRHSGEGGIRVQTERRSLFGNGLRTGDVLAPYPEPFVHTLRKPDRQRRVLALDPDKCTHRGQRTHALQVMVAEGHALQPG